MSFCYECSDRGYNVCLCTKNEESLFDKFVREVKEFQNTEEWLSLKSTASNKEVRALEQENARLREALESISKNTCCEPCQEAKIKELEQENTMLKNLLLEVRDSIEFERSDLIHKIYQLLGDKYEQV